MITGHEWTDREIAIAHPLYLAGSSASEIAKRLPGRTRNAVIGLAHRKGWTVANRQPASAPTATPLVVRTSRHAGAINARGNRPPAPHIEPGGLSKSSATPEQKRTFAAAGQKLVAVFAAPANDDAVLLMDRRRSQCAWPVGIPDRPANQRCCGKRVVEGANAALESYCADHAKVASSGIVRSERELSRSVRRYL